MPNSTGSESVIALVRPPAVEAFRFATTSIALPLGLAYIAAALEESGRTVRVIDAVGEQPEGRSGYFRGYLVGLPLEQIVERLPAGCSFVGITVVFTHEWPAVVRLIDLMRRAHPDLFIVLGGEHVTSLPEFCLKTSKADALVLGEGEETIVELATALEQGSSLHEVAGVAFRDEQKLCINQRRPRHKEVDDIARPAWDHFNVEVYHEHRLVGGMYSASVTIPMLATRGCPYQCTYCSAPNMWTPKWIPRDPVQVVDEIEYYIETYGARNFPFQDLTAIVKKDWIVQFCQELIRRELEITWQLPTGTRSEAIDAEVAGLLKQTGMVSVSYAPESGSVATRRFIKKQMKTDDLMRSIQAADEAGLNVMIFLVIGFPHDEPEHLRENFPFIDRLAKAGVTDCGVGFYMALPGTELFHSLYDSGDIKLDRAYFRHILASLSLVSSHSYNASMGNLALSVWKIRMLLRFYAGKSRVVTPGGLIVSLRRALSGLSSGDGAHESKLQTAFRNAITSGLETIRTSMGQSWIPRAEELRLFEDWDAIFREIRRDQVARGAIGEHPADTRDLHRRNVIPVLRQNHQTARSA